MKERVRLVVRISEEIVDQAIECGFWNLVKTSEKSLDTAIDVLERARTPPSQFHSNSSKVDQGLHDAGPWRMTAWT